MTLRENNSEETTEFHDYHEFRITCLSDKEVNLFFFFTTDLTNDSKEIQKELMRCKKEFMNLFADNLNGSLSLKSCENFNPMISSIHKNLSPRISFIGHPGVGKTTMINLISNEEIPVKHHSKLSRDISTMKIGSLCFELWDYIGKEQHGFLWSKFIARSDAVILITDSTLDNTEKSKSFLEIIEKSAPNAFSAVIANKQDLEHGIPPHEIEKVLGLKTYSIISDDPEYREKLIEILVDLLDMNCEVSHQNLLIMEIDFLKNALENAQKEEDLVLAYQIIRKILNICLELGNESFKKEFEEIEQDLKEKLNIDDHPQEGPSMDAKTASPNAQELPPKERMFQSLITNYIKEIETIMHVNISDREGTIILSATKDESGAISITKSTSELSGKDDSVENKIITVVCPSCKTRKKIPVPIKVVKEARTNSTFSIPKQLVCEHHFQIFVDKNFSVRGYQRVDLEIESYMDRILNEFGSESNFFTITTTSDKKIAYCSMGQKSILTTIAEPSTSDIELKVFSEYVAGKVELILEGNEIVDVEIPQVIRAISKTKGGKLPKGDFPVKMIVTGNFECGKTSIIKRFVENRFQESYKATIGVDISKKVIDLSKETKVSFIFWDIAGQKEFSSQRPRFFHGANVALIVMDRTRKETLEGVKQWYEDIKENVKDNIPIIILGNKSDLVDQIIVSEESIKKVANDYGLHYILTSAKTAENVNDAFIYVAYKYIEEQ